MVELKKKWVSTSPWRGYYEYENSVIDGHFRAMDETHNQFEQERIDKAKKILRKNKIPFRVKTAKTSNVFAVGYDVVVDKKNLTKAKAKLKNMV